MRRRRARRASQGSLAGAWLCPKDQPQHRTTHREQSIGDGKSAITLTGGQGEVSRRVNAPWMRGPGRDHGIPNYFCSRARGCAWSYAFFSRPCVRWVYTPVLESLACPSSSWTPRRMRITGTSQLAPCGNRPEKSAQQIRELFPGHAGLADECAQCPLGEFPMVGNRKTPLRRVTQNDVAACLMINLVAKLTKRSDRIGA